VLSVTISIWLNVILAREKAFLLYSVLFFADPHAHRRRAAFVGEFWGFVFIASWIVIPLLNFYLTKGCEIKLKSRWSPRNSGNVWRHQFVYCADRSDVTVNCSATGVHIGRWTAEKHHRGGDVASDDGRKVQGPGTGDHAGGCHVRLRGGRRCFLSFVSGDNK